MEKYLTKSIPVSKITQQKVKQASKKLGLKEDEFTEQAISFFLNAIKKNKQLNAEFELWDTLSDDALRRFEVKLK
jgi:hypothetical protein